MSQTEVQLIKDSAVVTADIADQAVTLDKLPHGTSSNDGKFLRANNGADPTFETVTGTTINTNADNRVITGSGTANTLNGESGLTYDGSNLSVTGGLDVSSDVSIADTIKHTGDTNTKIRFPAADTVAIETNGNERLRVDSSGRVMIGTTTEGNGDGDEFTIANVSGANMGMTIRSGTGALGNIFFSDATSGNAEFAGFLQYGHNDDSLRFGTNETTRMKIDSVGALLVGHSSSRNNFNSSVSTEHAPVIQLEGANQKRVLSLTAVSNSDGGFLILARQNGNVGDNTAVSSGNQLGKIDFQGSGGTNMEVAARISADCDGTPGDNDMPGRLCFKTTADGANSPSERIRIHSGGQVSMGQNSTYTSVNHDYQLVVTPNITDSSKGALGILIDGEHGTSGGASVDSISLKVLNKNTWNNATHQYGGYFEVNQQLLQPQTGVYSQATGLYNVQKCFSAQLNKNINAVTTGISYYSNIVETGSGGAAYHAQFFDNGTEKLQIRLGGNILNANNTYGSLSDVKLKENIVDANSQWDDIKGLKIRNFNFKNDPDKVKMLGVIAQEAETVSAGLIETNDDIEINDETGEGTKTGTTKYVKYSILYMKSVKALQEAMTRIETLETEVATLKSA